MNETGHTPAIRDPESMPIAQPHLPILYTYHCQMPLLP